MKAYALKGASDQVGELRVRGAEQVGRGKLNLETDLAGADAHGRKLPGRLMDERREMLFHPDGGAAAVNIPGEGKKLGLSL